MVERQKRLKRLKGRKKQNTISENRSEADTSTSLSTGIPSNNAII